MMMPGPEERGVRGTGGQVDEMTVALIDSAFDKDENVREIICSSLFDLGRKQPAMVLSSCHSYLVKHSKLPMGHRVVILNTIEKVVGVSIDTLSKSLAVDLIKQASEELTHSKEVLPDWQTAASGVLVAIGAKYCNEVMEELLQKFQPGTLPHFFIIQTMANLAAANVYGIVPFLTVILGTMLPIMGMAKQDNMRWVFSSALAKFSEAVLDYVANLERAPDTSVRKEAFAGEVYAAYDILFNIWLRSSEPKLRLAVVEAIGQMTHIMAKDKLEEQLPKLIPGILSLYRKHPESFHITQGLCMVLDAATEGGSLILEPHMDNLINALYPQVCIPPDYNNPVTVKNHNELLRCFAVIAKSFSDRLVGWLLQRLENVNEKNRIGSLSIIKHLVNAAGPLMEDKHALVVSGLKIVLNETNNKVKKVFAQVIIAMAHHGYLELEGGELMVEFVVRQCAIPAEPQGRRPNDPEYISNDALRLMCANVLQLITTTIDKMEVVMWPYLIEFVTKGDYTDAMGAICRGLAHLAAAKREEGAEDYDIDFDEQVNLPKPPALIARFLVMCGLPGHGNNRGIHVLHAMKGLSPNLHENLVALWDTVIPKLLQYLEDALDDETKYSQKNWEDLLLKLLSKTLDEVNQEDWICDVGMALGDQIPLYDKHSEEKNFLYKCLGVVMRKSTKKDFVTKYLDVIFSSVKHSSQEEREGCAIALGFTAASHLDAVLSKLEDISKNHMNRKSAGLFGFIKDLGSPDPESEHIKATVMLCFGYVTLYSPPSLIVSRMEATILRTINPHFANVKDVSVRENLIRSVHLLAKALRPERLQKTYRFKGRSQLLEQMEEHSTKQNLIRCVDLMGKALHPSHLKKSHSFREKKELILHLQKYMKAESTHQINNETRALALGACATLVKLDPKLTTAENFDLIKSSIDSVFPLPPDGISVKRKEEDYTDAMEQEVLMEATVEALDDLFKEILLKDVSPEGLEGIFKHLSPWLVSEHDHERERALSRALPLFTTYLEKLEVGVGMPTVLSNMGSMLAMLVPRTTDPNMEVRQIAVDCVQTVLRISQKYSGQVEDGDQMVEALTTLKERVQKSDPNVLFSVINDLSKVLCKKVPANQLVPFLEVLYESLLDPHAHSSSGACVVLNTVMKVRGAELRDQVEKILEILHNKLDQIEAPQTKIGTLRAIRTLTTHHLVSLLSSLLNYPLPFDDNVVEIFKILSQDPQLTRAIFEHLLDMLARGLPYEEKPDPRDKNKTIKTATTLSTAAICALGEMFKVVESEMAVTENYHRLFSALMLRMSACIGVNPPVPKAKEEKKAKDKEESKSSKSKPKPKSTHHKNEKVNPSSSAVEAMRQFLIRSHSVDIIETLDSEKCWEDFEDEEKYPDAYTVLSRALCQHQGGYVAKVVSCLTPGMTSLHETQRVAIAAFVAEIHNNFLTLLLHLNDPDEDVIRLINQECGGDTTLVEMLMNSLLGRLVDTSHIVRMLCIRGLGNVASVGSDQVHKYSTMVLSAMMAGMDDKEDTEDDITLEAMSGLSRVLAKINESDIRAILINVALRIRPCFEKDRASVRAAAFTLFGNLSRFGDGPSKAPFLEQIHNNFVTLLLHLNDPDEDVIRSCKYALRLLGPLLGSDSVSSMFQKHLLEDAHLHYGEFINDLAKAIIVDFPDKLNFYVMGNVAFFKSVWPEIRSNAAMFAGFLLGNLPKDQHIGISKEHVSSALIMLLKDSSPSVRVKTAEAMSLLYDY